MTDRGLSQFARRAIFNRNFFVVLAIDAFLLTLSWLGSYAARFDFDIPEAFGGEMLALLPAVISIKIVYFYFLTSTVECGASPVYPIS
jgi:hypothetical protein